MNKVPTGINAFYRQKMMQSNDMYISYIDTKYPITRIFLLFDKPITKRINCRIKCLDLPLLDIDSDACKMHEMIHYKNVPTLDSSVEMEYIVKIPFLTLALVGLNPFNSITFEVLNATSVPTLCFDTIHTFTPLPKNYLQIPECRREIMTTFDKTHQFYSRHGLPSDRFYIMATVDNVAIPIKSISLKTDRLKLIGKMSNYMLLDRMTEEGCNTDKCIYYINLFSHIEFFRLRAYWKITFYEEVKPVIHILARSQLECKISDEGNLSIVV